MLLFVIQHGSKHFISNMNGIVRGDMVYVILEEFWMCYLMVVTEDT